MLIIALISLNLIGISYFGYWDTYVRVGVFTVTFPYVFITIWVSRHKGANVLFNIATCLFIGSIGAANGLLAEFLFPHFDLARPMARIISFAFLYILLFKLRQPYFRMLYMLKRGWIILCMVPITTFLVFVYIGNYIYLISPVPALIVMYSTLIICSCAYALIYLFFEKVQQEYEAQRNSDLLSMQLHAVGGRIEAIQVAEDKVRIERHDLRHRLATVASLLEKNERDTALKYIGQSQQHLDSLQLSRWCKNPILDAILSSYFQQIEAEGIRLDTQIAITDDLQVSAADLSIVFANALENAINACRKMPMGKRQIIFKCISKPQLMMEVSNSYSGDVIINSYGLPVATERGHGIGTRSIAAFVEKYKALCDYQVKDGWFRLRISL